MIPILLGTDQATNKNFYLNPDLLRTHLHLLGATGAGKTVAIITLLRQLLMNSRPKSAVFVIDPMGNLSQDLLLWMANERLCPEHVRERLVYLEPAREGIVMPFNPLLHASNDHLYYQCGRAVEIVLRAWASQNIEEMPRLRQWTFACFFAAAAMGFPISACRYLLRPGNEEHTAMLARLPPELRFMWSEVLSARGNEAIRLLESTRNRLAPFFDSGILRRMFGSTENRLNVPRFIRDRRIVIFNLASQHRLDQHIAHTIGGLAVNEIIQSAMSMSQRDVDPTYLLLDEFQHFVGNDLYDALPLVRQIGLRLILAHQSFSQLELGDLDLTGIIWQARSRLMFANDADDADRIAHELATLTYDPYKLKEILHTFRQKIVGHRREWLRNTNQGATSSRSIDTSESESNSRNQGESRAPGEYRPTKSGGTSSSRDRGRSEKQSDSMSSSEGKSETLVPVHEDFVEISRKTYFSFDEQRIDWAKKIRTKRTGAAFGKFKDDPRLYDLAINHIPIIETPELIENREKLLERNFSQDCFISKEEVERQGEQQRQLLLSGESIVIKSDEPTSGSNHEQSSTGDTKRPETDVHPFR